MTAFKSIQQKNAPMIYRLCEHIYNNAQLKFFTANCVIGMTFGAIGGYIETDKKIQQLASARTEIVNPAAPPSAPSFDDSMRDMLQKPVIATSIKTLGTAAGLVGGGIGLAWAMNSLVVFGSRKRRECDHKNYIKAHRNLNAAQ